MLHFTPICIEHKKQVDEYLCSEQYGSTESAFTDLYIWGAKFNTQICFHEGFLFVRSGTGANTRYLFPFGTGKQCQALEILRQDAVENGNIPLMVGVTDRMREKLEDCRPGAFLYEEDRDVFDYIYNAQDLITLPGKKYHQKRNHINRFQATYAGRYVYETITRENLDEVYEFQKHWLAENSTAENSEELQMEMEAIERAIGHYFELGLIGGFIRIDGNIAAYTMGTKLCCDSFLIPFEKGDYQYAGIYQIMNQLFAERNCSEVSFINREDDTGAPGLRKAKLSYYPEILLAKYRVTWKDEK